MAEQVWSPYEDLKVEKDAEEEVGVKRRKSDAGVFAENVICSRE